MVLHQIATPLSESLVTILRGLSVPIPTQIFNPVISSKKKIILSHSNNLRELICLFVCLY